jgi:hypothetical protein
MTVELISTHHGLKSRIFFLGRFWAVFWKCLLMDSGLARFQVSLNLGPGDPHWPKSRQLAQYLAPNEASHCFFT